MVARFGLPAILNCEPRQAWKGAAVAVDVCAGVSTVRAASRNNLLIYLMLAENNTSSIMKAEQTTILITI